LAGGGQRVFDDGDAARYDAAAQDAVGFHLAELLGENFLAHAQRAAQPAEVARAVADFPEDE